MTTFTKEERSRHLISSAASVVAVLAVLAPAVWFLAKPVLVSSISTAMADGMEEKIDKKLAPMNNGFKAIIQQNINRLRRDISRLEYIRQAEPQKWTPQMSDDLTNMQIDLDGQLMALDAIRAAEK
jgi:hypothetical protein